MAFGDWICCGCGLCLGLSVYPIHALQKSQAFLQGQRTRSRCKAFGNPTPIARCAFPMTNGAVTFANTPKAFIECQCRGMSAQPPKVKTNRAVSGANLLTSAAFFPAGAVAGIINYPFGPFPRGACRHPTKSRDALPGLNGKVLALVFHSGQNASPGTLILKLCNQALGYIANAFKAVSRVLDPLHAPKGDHVVVMASWFPLQFITHFICSSAVAFTNSVAGIERNRSCFHGSGKIIQRGDCVCCH